MGGFNRNYLPVFFCGRFKHVEADLILRPMSFNAQLRLPVPFSLRGYMRPFTW